MKAYRNLKVFIASFLVFYAGLGVFARVVLGPPGEIFPVFTWCLFCRVPNEVHDYALRILAVGSEKLEPTPYFQDAGQWFQKSGSIDAYYSIQEFGAAVLTGNRDRIEEVRRFLEPLYLEGLHAVRYEVVERSFNPMDRWKYGTFKSVRSLGVFERFAKEK